MHTARPPFARSARRTRRAAAPWLRSFAAVEGVTDDIGQAQSVGKQVVNPSTLTYSGHCQKAALVLASCASCPGRALKFDVNSSKAMLWGDTMNIHNIRERRKTQSMGWWGPNQVEEPRGCTTRSSCVCLCFNLCLKGVPLEASYQRKGAPIFAHELHCRFGI